MYLAVIILIIIVAVLLGIVVLLQNSKGGGLASEFSSSNQIMGVRKTTDFLEKTTWTLAIILVVLSFVTCFMGRGSRKKSDNLSKAQQAQSTAAPMTQPAAAPMEEAAAPAPEVAE
ncbi:MAG: preprotein translocase subunit SecG [Bacteroidales bacterium]|nr:preprotein translocase subunit SecG [Bacteroidales bacterium]